MRNRVLKSAGILATSAALTACAQMGMDSGHGATGSFYRPDLNDSTTARIARGQFAADVTALLGAPFHRVRFDNTKTTAWDYRYRDTWGYWIEYSVLMGDDGRVTGTFSKRLDPVDRE